jgi:hypothetical protein
MYTHIIDHEEQNVTMTFTVKGHGHILFLMVDYVDASNHGWGTHMNDMETSGTWSTEMPPCISIA